jgi:phage-related protein
VKKVIWHPKARGIISAFPESVRQELGYLLFRVQNGETFGMPHSSPMKTVAAGASELRVRGADGIYRAFYFTKSSEGILVFHGFVKKTPVDEIDVRKKRLKELLED